MTPPPSTPGQPRPSGLLVIALYEGTKGLLLVFVAVGLLHLVHRDMQEVAKSWAHRLHLNVERHAVADLCARAGLITPHRMSQLSVVAFLLGGLHLVQGVGLYLGKRWAEALTVAATAAFIPLELYELAQHVTALRGAALLANVALVGYLVTLLQRRRRRELPAPAAAGPDAVVETTGRPG